jgi:3-phenylpropionate/cinnamic acid dioxygenase small subunit
MEHANAAAQVPADQPADASVRYVNDARYEQLWALWREARRADLAATPADSETASLLFREARLLDDRHYGAWLDLYAKECLYWVPNRFEPSDPRGESGIYLDDRRRMIDRVALIQTGHLHAQTPPSRTRRMLSNLEQVPLPSGALLVRANVVIWEYRKGAMRTYAGWQCYEINLGRAQGPISTKILCFLDCDAPQGNYSFIF